MYHLLKSSPGPRRHTLQSATIDTLQNKAVKVSAPTQTDDSWTPKLLNEILETTALATEALSAANKTQISLARFMQESVSRLKFYSEEESKYFSEMSSRMESFAEDFQAVTQSSGLQSQDLVSVNSKLQQLNQRYRETFPENCFDSYAHQGTADSLQVPTPPKVVKSDAKPRLKRTDTIIRQDRREVTPEPIHGVLDSTSFFVSPTESKYKTKRQVAKTKKKPYARRNAVTSPMKEKNSTPNPYLTVTENPLKVIIRRDTPSTE